MSSPHPTTARRFVLGVDLGTSACKVSLVDEQGKLVAEAREGYATSSPHPGWSEQNPADWLKAVVTAVQQLMKTFPAAPDCLAGIV